MPGMMYANDDGAWAGRCTIHDAWEMFHSCSGGEGEPMGYCEAWPGDYIEGIESEKKMAWQHLTPTCKFERPNYEEET